MKMSPQKLESKRAAGLRKAFYSPIDPRRRFERADGHMVHEDDTAFANLPRQAIHAEYPKLQHPFFTPPLLEMP